MLKNIELLKLEFLTQGMKISRRAEEAFTENGKRPATLADYASTSGIPLKLDNDIWVNAPFLEDFCKKSSIIFDFDRGGISLYGIIKNILRYQLRFRRILMRKIKMIFRI